MTQPLADPFKRIAELEGALEAIRENAEQSLADGGSILSEEVLRLINSHVSIRAVIYSVTGYSWECPGCDTINDVDSPGEKRVTCSECKHEWQAHYAG